MPPKKFVYILLIAYVVLIVLFILDIRQDEFRWYPYLGVLAMLMAIGMVLISLKEKNK